MSNEPSQAVRAELAGTLLGGKLKGELCDLLAGLQEPIRGYQSLDARAFKHLQVVPAAVCSSSQSQRPPELGREEEASQKEGISAYSKKKGTQFEGNWNSRSRIGVFAMSPKPVFRLGTLLCLEERGGFLPVCLSQDFCYCSLISYLLSFLSGKWG